MRIQTARGEAFRVSQKTHLILDVDGVLTDGGVYAGPQGKLFKRFGPDDNDALKQLKSEVGLSISVVSADQAGWEITTARLKHMGLRYQLVGAKDRVSVLPHVDEPHNIIYMGDGWYDADVFPVVGLGVAPANAYIRTLERADLVTSHRGGDRAVAELVEWLLLRKEETE